MVAGPFAEDRLAGRQVPKFEAIVPDNEEPSVRAKERECFPSSQTRQAAEFGTIGHATDADISRTVDPSLAFQGTVETHLQAARRPTVPLLSRAEIGQSQAGDRLVAEFE